MSRPQPSPLDTNQQVQLAGLWSRNQYLVEAFIRSLVRDATDRDDILQETAKQVAMMFHEYDSDRPFANWVVGIARFKVLECQNRTRRDRKMVGSEVLDQVAGAFARVTTDKAPRIAAMETCVGKLAPRHRQLLDLRYTESMGVQAIADRVGLKPNTISVALYKVRAGLAECIRKQLGLEGRGGYVG